MSKETIKLSTKQAVTYLLATEKVASKYALAKTLAIQPIMINNYLDKDTRMGEDTAKKMLDLFNIEITDIFIKRQVITNDNTVDTSN